MFVYSIEIIRTCVEMTWRHETSLCYEKLQQLASYHALLFELLLVGMDCHYAIEGLKCIATSKTSSPHIKKKNSIHKLIHVIQIFMEKIFMVQYYL